MVSSPGLKDSCYNELDIGITKEREDGDIWQTHLEDSSWRMLCKIEGYMYKIEGRTVACPFTASYSLLDCFALSRLVCAIFNRAYKVCSLGIS